MVHNISDDELAEILAQFNNIDTIDTADDLQIACGCINIGQIDKKPGLNVRNRDSVHQS